MTGDLRERRLIARRIQLLGSPYRLFYDRPVHVIRGEGVWLYDDDGRRYLDVYNNVASVGHCHPDVVRALSRQAATLNTHTRYLGEMILDFAEQLLVTLPSEVDTAIFTCTGSEANDLALRIARRRTRGTGVLVTDFAYHGATAALAELSPGLGADTPLAAHVRTVPLPSDRSSAAAAGHEFAAGVRRALVDLDACGIAPAAFIVDSIFASDGICAQPAGFLREATEVVRASGALLIADEVQGGLGRTGECFWSFQRHGIVPDIVTMGKGMGNGHPVAGLAARRDVVEEFGRSTRYFNTSAGNAVSAAAGLAVLEVIARERLMDNARDVGEYLMARLQQLAAPYPMIREVRGAGLFVGVEIVMPGAAQRPAPYAAAALVNALRDRFVLAGLTGRHRNVLKLRPPLPFAREHVDLLVEALRSALDDISQPLKPPRRDNA